MRFTNVLMPTSALVLAGLGVATLFLPAELGAWLGLGAGSELAVQLSAAGFLSVAALNWMGRTAIYGGIFGRPIVMANLMLGTVSSLSLVSALLGGDADPRLWALALLLGLHALAFTVLLRSAPHTRTSP